jgi:hypothetical protein
MSVKTINRYDLVSGAEAECYVTIGDNRYNFASAKSLEATVEKTKKNVPVLGRRPGVNMTTGLKYTGKMTVYYNTSILRVMMYHYKVTGEDLYAQIDVTNDDPTTNIGRQAVTLTGVNFNSVILAKFDITSDDPLDEDVEFTFEDFEIPDKFALLQSMV